MDAQGTLKIPAVFDFTDYRQYLRAFYQFKKQLNPEFSHAVFSERAGLKSRSYLRLVMTAKRNLTADMIPKFSRGLELAKNESLAFEALVHFTQSASMDSKRTYWEKFLDLRPKNESTQRIRDEYVFLARFSYPVLLVLLQQPHAIHDVEGLSHLTGLTTAQIREGIESLENLGAVKRVGEDYVTSPINFVTSNDIPNIAIQTFHKNILKKASEAVNLPIEEREFQSVIIPLNDEERSYLKKRLRDIAKEMDLMFDGKRPKSNRVYSLNLSLIPLTPNFVRTGLSASQNLEEDDGIKEKVK